MKLKHSFLPLLVATSLMSTSMMAQDNLVNALKDNKSENSKSKFKFTDVINLENLPVQNQGSSGTCWSYSGSSFVESEMAKAGKKPVKISEMYSARCVYIEKGKQYVRMHGSTALGDGGSLHDVLDVIRRYGAVPQYEYTGLNYGTKLNDFSELASIRDGMLEAIVKPKKGKLTPNWLSAFTAAVDAYLGVPPESFTYNGKKYTPRTFADEVIGINPDNYVEMTNWQGFPLYKQFVLPIPDNWSQGLVYNVKMQDLTDVIDNALKNGYTINWATDVSEKYFSWKNGVAYVPEVEFEDMTEEQKKEMFDGPKNDRKITEDLRQDGLDRYLTTDDHGMHIVGIAKDQNGKEYYIVKNSWGNKNDYEGYLYVTKAYVQYKTTSILLNKKGLPNELRHKLGL